MSGVDVPKWMLDARMRAIRDVATALGLKTRDGRSFSPCPSCGRDQRGSSDRRGPVGTTTNGLGWSCHRCSAAGDAIDLVAFHLDGKRYRTLESDGRTLVREWFEGPSSPKRIVRPQEANRPPKRPPLDQVRQFWNRCIPVTDDAEVGRWLELRSLNLSRLADRDLIRAVPKEMRCPRWAYFRGQPWTRSGHRAVVRMYDHSGTFLSLHARSVLPAVPAGEKAAAPAGAQLLGLVFADQSTQSMFHNGGHPTDVLITEGEPDWLSVATYWGDYDDRSPACIGVVAGCWTEHTTELARAIPAGSKVVLATHQDAAGEKYARRIFKSFCGLSTKVVRGRWN